MSEQEATPAPDDVAQAGRVRLADWLSAETGNPELATTVEELAGWPAYRSGEFLIFVPPGFANRIFLLTERVITSFAPSEQSLPQAMEAVRNPS